MKAHVMTTGVIFGLLTLVHVWRVIEEPHLATDPWHILTTAVAAVLFSWACYLLWLARGRRAQGSPGEHRLEDEGHAG